MEDVDLFWILIGAFYFVPTIIAVFNRKRDSPLIFFSNLVFGWTVLGWAFLCMHATLRDDPFQEQGHW